MATVVREIGRRDTVLGDRKVGKCLVLGDSIYGMLELNVQILKLSAFRALERNNCIELLKTET